MSEVEELANKYFDPNNLQNNTLGNHNDSETDERDF